MNEEKHIFKTPQIPDDPLDIYWRDWCEVCGHNFRNTDYHLTLADN